MEKVNQQYSDAEFATVNTLDILAALCYDNSKSKGFWDDQEKLERAIQNGVMETAEVDRLLTVLRKAIDAQKVALMHSELGEATEAQRKDLPSDKIPFTGEEEEYADTIIRILDHCGRKRLRIGEAVVHKMRYNSGRPFMHGKQY